MNRQDVIKAIERYSEKSGLKPTTVCHYAMANRKFYDRLKSGYFHEEYAARLLRWMDDHPPKSHEAAE